MFRKSTRRPARRRTSAKRCESRGTEALEVRLLLATFRSIDGSGNNQTVPGAGFGVAGSNLIRSGYDAEFPDGFGDQITSATAPNPRTVSNTISAQNAPVFSTRNLSDWIVQWGQFLTHDMDFTGTAAANNVLSTGATGTFSIPITDSNDPLGPNAIPFNRSDFDPSTGNSTRIPLPGPGNQTRPNWREQINDITSFIDASNVYGSDTTRANNLRTFVGGKLKTTAGGLLPGLNDAGEENDNAVGHDPTDLFLAGDVRANEAVGLTATHALFIREHNRLADLLKAQNASLTDEEIYQWARKIVGAEMQIITYEEFLPALMGTSAPSPNAYVYKNQVDATITTSFSTAFFRFGHSQQSSTLKLVNDNGSMAGEFSLADIFFNPDILQESPTLVDQVMKGLASQVSQENDILVVDEIRNFLFGPPGAGGLDLAALDIQRGRDHGMLDFNEFRMTYGLQPLNSFAQLTSNTALQAKLQTLYGNINNVDAWVGGIAENHLSGKSIGSMLNASFIEQFTRTRDGDRFFYTGDADLNNSLVTSIINLNNLTLASIIRNNTGIANIQDNVFFTAAGFSVVQTNGNTIVSESGTTDTFSVTLNRAPTSNVVLTVTTGDSGEATVDKTTLTFTPANWSVAQIVTVTGVDDAIVDGDQTFNITIAVNDASSDNDFDPLPDQTVSVTTTDNDTRGITVSAISGNTTEAGGTATFTVVLNTQPTGDVTINLSSDNTDEGTVSPASLTFTPVNWGTAQTVTVTGVDDSVGDGNVSFNVILAPAVGGGYDGIDPTDVAVVNQDNEGSLLDVDRNASADAATDGILIIRYLFGFRGDALIAGAAAPDASNTTAAEIEAALDSSLSVLDADGNGIRDAATDGILIIRYLFGFRDDALVSGAIGGGAVRTTGPEVAAFLNGFLPPPPTSPATTTDSPPPQTPLAAAFETPSPKPETQPPPSLASLVSLLFPPLDPESTPPQFADSAHDELDQEFENGSDWVSLLNL